jgi:hypothetical protein
MATSNQQITGCVACSPFSRASDTHILFYQSNEAACKVLLPNTEHLSFCAVPGTPAAVYDSISARKNKKGEGNNSAFGKTIKRPMVF